jgi:hypothetical protein
LREAFERGLSRDPVNTLICRRKTRFWFLLLQTDSVSSTGFDLYRVGSLLSSHAYMCRNPMKAFFFILWFGTAVIDSYGRKHAFEKEQQRGYVLCICELA